MNDNMLQDLDDRRIFSQRLSVCLDGRHDPMVERMSNGGIILFQRMLSSNVVIEGRRRKRHFYCIVLYRIVLFTDSFCNIYFEKVVCPGKVGKDQKRVQTKNRKE